MSPSFRFPLSRGWQPCLTAALLGVASHLFYYIKSNHEPQIILIVCTHLVLVPLVSTTVAASHSLTVDSLLSSVPIWLSFHAGLLASMVIYRALFHPLRLIPGPFWARITKIPTIVTARSGKVHELHTEWARKYGPVVRIAPNEVLITSVSAINIVHGPHSRTTKHHTFYDYMHYHGVLNLDSIYDRGEHRERRRVWDLALSTKNMEFYELNAREAARVWVRKVQVAAMAYDSLDVSRCMSLVAFDNMTRTGFSLDCGSLNPKARDRLIHLMQANFARTAASGHSMWPLLLMSTLGFLEEEGQFDQLTYETVLMREDNSSELKDVMQYFLDDFRSEQPRAFHDRRAVFADAQAVMLAGTDTLSALLTHCYYYLAKNPGMRDQLREELSLVFGNSCPTEVAYKDLISLPCLDSVISETLRMHSPLCNGGPRVTTEDTVIEGSIIPKDVTVYVGIHSIQRSPKYFVCPDEWKPERWTSRPDLILDKRAYHPFLTGPFNCVGKRLALMAAKIVLSYTISLYDFGFPPGQDGSSFLKDCRNRLILKPGKLECVFTELCPR